MGRYLTRWLIPLPAILFTFFPQTANADNQPGLATTYYTIDEIPPLQSTTQYPVCGSETENNINRSYDGEPYDDCTYDLFMVHITGFIDIPEHETIEFWLASDDGGEITIDNNTFGVWYDQGCSATESGELDLEPGSQPLEVWMYENGGGTCLMLAWNINGQGWEIVPDEAFTYGSPATTTSTTTSTTTTSTTTTVPQTTTSSTTTLPTTTTTTTEPVQTTTTTSTTSTTTTTTTTTPPAPTTVAPYTPPQTTTSTTQPQPAPTTTAPVEPEPETTTTTTTPETSTTHPASTVPDTTLPPVSFPTSTLPAETTPPTSTQTTTPNTVETPTTTILIPSTTTLPQITEQLTTSQAAQIASNPEVLATITETEAEQLFEQLNVDELTEEQLEQFTEAIQQAPTEVKKAFEKTINIFGSQFENYIPTGSNIPVKTRRTLVAAGALIAAIPSTRVRR